MGQEIHDFVVTWGTVIEAATEEEAEHLARNTIDIQKDMATVEHYWRCWCAERF